jgi:phosphonate transport system substrate-binding protein
LDNVKAIVLPILLCGFVHVTFADEVTDETDRDQPVRIGAVAYSPSTVTVFRDLTRYLNNNGLPADFVLYSGYDALVSALDGGEVDIAWNTPLAHGQYHVRNQCSSRTLVMRDVDFNVRSMLIVRADSGIESLEDLAGKRLVLGSCQSAEATVVPLHFLKAEGVDFNEAKIVSLDQEVDSKGNPCASPRHVLQALREGRGDAGVITAGLWNRVKDQASKEGSLEELWTSPPFSHCVFTASTEFDEQLAARFTRLMTAMDPNDPSCANIMRLEGTKKWLPGQPEGFDALVEALRTEQ